MTTTKKQCCVHTNKWDTGWGRSNGALKTWENIYHEMKMTCIILLGWLVLGRIWNQVPTPQCSILTSVYLMTDQYRLNRKKDTISSFTCIVTFNT